MSGSPRADDRLLRICSRVKNIDRFYRLAGRRAIRSKPKALQGRNDKERMTIMRVAILSFAAGLAALAPAMGAGRMQFWNLTANTITELSLAPAGTTAFGPNQCANDKDGSVDHDERLKLVGIKPGQYDVRLKDDKGRICTVHDVSVKGDAKYAFSLSDKDLKDCTK